MDVTEAETVDYEHILFTKAEGVAIVTLNRPRVLNALNLALEAELNDALDAAEQDADVHCIVLTGAGERAFSSGRDIKEMAESAEAASSLPGADRDYNLRLAFGPKPTIGAINGLAYGGGALLASSLDLRIGCERSQFRFLGTSAGRLNSTWTLAVQIGMPKAKEILFSSRIVEPEEALSIGLLNHLVPADQLMVKTLEIAQAIAQNPPELVQGVKQLLNDYVGLRWQDMASTELEARQTRFKPPPPEESFRDFLSRER